jgi:hypothetical protein
VTTTTTTQLVPLTSALRAQVDPRRCNFDRLGDVDLELGRRVRDGLVAENLAAFLPDPPLPAPIAARTCSGLAVAARAATARRLAELRAAWVTSGGADR